VRPGRGAAHPHAACQRADADHRPRTRHHAVADREALARSRGGGRALQRRGAGHCPERARQVQVLAMSTGRPLTPAPAAMAAAVAAQVQGERLRNLGCSSARSGAPCSRAGRPHGPRCACARSTRPARP
jgi:hypothetical protein